MVCVADSERNAQARKAGLPILQCFTGVLEQGKREVFRQNSLQARTHGALHQVCSVLTLLLVHLHSTVGMHQLISPCAIASALAAA